MFIERKLKPVLLHYASKFGVVAVVGPRQAGKTTLTKEVFWQHRYFSLEDPDTLEAVRNDPRDFLERNYGTPGIIIDEFQNEPTLLSYMQGIVDANYRPGYFILTGSQNFLMKPSSSRLCRPSEAITQSLAGRVALLTLLPLAAQELQHSSLSPENIDTALFNGGYPNIFSRNMTPAEFYPQYTKTYVERDVRQLINVAKLSEFQRFMRLCAGRIGQIFNATSLADDCNVSVPTVNSWISILEASYVVFLLQPHFKNFSKRLIKSPKLYFYDTGLACWLLKIGSSEQLHDHYLRGGLMESFVIAEFYKAFFNKGQEPSVYFWRDSHGHEVDCLLDYGVDLVPVEIKSGATVNQRFFDNLKFWCTLAEVDPALGYVVYTGTQRHERSGGTVVGWQEVGSIPR
ncbi:ATP-binding protein [Candidatus Babeliales bacterium]|nr:ATP-binding protein [Candidatus Babeliales bacterium]